MTPKEAQRTAAHARRLLTFQILTPTDYAVLDAMLWRLRPLGRKVLQAPYKTIARLAGIGRDAAINSVRKLETLHLIKKAMHRIKVFWGHNRAQVASRQTANSYEFCVPGTESANPAADKGITRIIPRGTSTPVENSEFERALQRLGAAQKGANKVGIGGADD
jgi:hypothetical protein